MSFSLIIVLSIGYIALLFVLAYVTSKHKTGQKLFANSSTIYALSLGVYCTAWTFYGSVGQASQTGLGFLGVYLGPTLIAPLWYFILSKIIRISRHLRITSIADFISSRYGKNTTLGLLVSDICVLIVIPYISIQLKAIEFSVSLLHSGNPYNLNLGTNKVFYQDPALLYTIAFALFAILFGTRKMDPSEKHPGVVNVIAIESIIKLIAFIIGGIAIVYFVFDGLEDIFSQAYDKLDLNQIMYIHENGYDYSSWFWVMVLSAIAFLILPRQFHMAVVENNDISHIKRASWLTPLYLMMISIFVIPVALAGLLLFENSVEADTFLLSIPIEQGYTFVTAVVFFGGLSAISGMIIISVMSLSIMISNNVFLPILLRVENQYKFFLDELDSRILQLRRVLIFLILLPMIPPY